MIDLHSHTTASDGSLTPTELVDLAKKVGLSAVAVTDHDTIGGLAEASAAALARDIEFVPGVELSVDYPKPGQFHLLGLFVDFRSPDFSGQLTALQDNRVNRNHRMVEQMQAAGIPITLADFEAEAGGGQIGRPHMAKALVRKGIVATVQQAFDEFLADGKPWHIPKMKLEPPEAIDLVHRGGGLAILAHPKYLRIAEEDRLADTLGQFQALGLDGIEVYYSQHTPADTETYLRLARRFNFLVSAGSDFHGVTKPTVHLGQIYQGLAGDDALLARLKEAQGLVA
jgi:predicted metal-dependent phosphoesterase TrpH